MAQVILASPADEVGYTGAPTASWAPPPFTYPPFEALKISTMTAIAQLNGTVNLLGAYGWLPQPLYHWQHGLVHKSNKPIPWSGVAGTISSLRIAGRERGYPRDHAPLKNSVTLGMDTPDKNVSIKLGPQKLHITGAKSEEEIRVAGQLLCQLLIAAHQDFLYCQARSAQWSAAVHWVLSAAQGPTILREAKVVVDPKAKKAAKRNPQPSGELESPALITLVPDIAVNLITTGPAPELQLDQRMLGLLVPLTRAFRYYSELYQHLALMNCCTGVIGDSAALNYQYLAVTGVQLGMTNYNYHIGFNVDRIALASHMESYGFVVDYHNDTDVGVKFLLPYQANDTVIAHRKKATKNTFILYRCGQIAQSGPDPERGREAYNKFMSVISLIYPAVQLRTG